MERYRAEILPLNADKIGTKAHGTAEFSVDGDTLHISLEMFDTPANVQHWEHFHGFPDGKDASVPTAQQDVNHDGYIDLVETEPVSGTTMVPLDAAPHEMCIPNDNYPVADDQGHYSYEKDVPYQKLLDKFKEAFGGSELDLDKRVVYVHGVPDSLVLPDTVAGKINDKYDQHVTLPIAAGKIEKISD
ncbi:hypothetical protein J2Z60_000709 [Lactobacillus colini]|uniref:Uncharacterized protein n=1 Tax=Lactobacillus colini TaxID=1819254 RepID=A0ABS4MD62_9LACO|nr:hypothetical protein [Lactobacillus colini]MBP2057538.1 hypothetical protein [Lactobacillus colini]